MFKVQLHKKVEAGDPRYRLPRLNLTHLLRGGQVRAGVYARFGFLATIPATQRKLFIQERFSSRINDSLGRAGRTAGAPEKRYNVTRKQSSKGVFDAED